uniref:hypothetical protein n=1 Tax=Rhizobium rhizogenes TaxID=359 RepID=UPI001F414D2A|nr:hypothetical protein [Rhizobium rhizogenes]
MAPVVTAASAAISCKEASSYPFSINTASAERKIRLRVAAASSDVLLMHRPPVAYRISPLDERFSARHSARNKKYEIGYGLPQQFRYKINRANTGGTSARSAISLFGQHVSGNLQSAQLASE